MGAVTMDGQYEMGFAPCTRPRTERQVIEELVEQFAESDDDCLCRECSEVREAKALQTVVSRVCRDSVDASCAGISCRRVGKSVYLVKND